MVSRESLWIRHCHRFMEGHFKLFILLFNNYNVNKFLQFPPISSIPCKFSMMEQIIMDPVPPVLVPRRVISVQLITPTVNLFNNLLDQKHDLKKIYDLEEKMLAVLHFFKNLPQPDCFKLFISWNFSFFWGGGTINMGPSFYAKNLGFLTVAQHYCVL